MKQLTFLLSLLFVLSVPAMAQQKTVVNDANAEKRNVESFNGVSVSGGLDVYLVQGGEDGVAVSASEPQYRARIVTEVKNGVLTIWFNNQGKFWGMDKKKLRAYISFRDLKTLRISGSCDVYITGVLKGSSLDLSLSGSSDLKGAVDLDNLKADMSGASDIVLSGKVGALSITGSGSSDFKNYDLVSQTCDAHVSGSSDVEVTVEKELSGSASGSSDIRFRGNGVIKKSSTSGSSSIRKS